MKASRWLRPLLSLLLVGLLLHLVDLSQVVRAVRAVDHRWLIAAIASFAMSVLVFAAKWRVCLPQTRPFPVLRSYLASLCLSLLPTGSFSGELSKLALARTERISASLVAASIAFDKMTGLAALCLVGFMASLFAAVPWAMQSAIGLLLAGVLLAVTPRFSSALCRVLSLLPTQFRWMRHVEAVLRAVASLGVGKGVLWRSLGLGLIGQLAMVAVYVLLGHGLGVDPRIADMTVVVVLANLISLVPITVGGIGAREVGLVALLTTIGVPKAVGLSLALCVFGVFLIGAFLGLVSLLWPTALERPKAS